MTRNGIDTGSARRGSMLSPGGDMRCPCGALVARVIAGGIELKCRRCKRVVTVALPEEEDRGGSRWVAVEPCRPGGASRGAPAGTRTRGG